MSIQLIEQRAKSIVEAFDSYRKLLSAEDYDKKREEKIREYMMSLSENIDELIDEVRKNVRE